MTRKLRVFTAFLLSVGWLFAVTNNSNAVITEISATVNEGEVLQLAAPQGFKIDHIVFASYGTPINYTIDPNCHSVDSLSIIQAAIQNETLVISADNSIFGDPCGGVYKHLSVILAIQDLPQVVVDPPLTPTIGAPTNLNILDSNTAATLSWNAPIDGNTMPERYAISFTCSGCNGWGIATGNVGDSNALNTTIIIDHSLLNLRARLRRKRCVYLRHIPAKHGQLSSL